MTKQGNETDKKAKHSQGNMLGDNIALGTGWEGMFADWLVNQEYGINNIGGTSTPNNPMSLILGGESNPGINPGMFSQLTRQQQELLAKNLAEQRLNPMNANQMQGNDNARKLETLLGVQKATGLNILQNLQEGGVENMGNKSNLNRKKTNLSSSQRKKDSKLPSSSNTNIDVNQNIPNVIPGIHTNLPNQFIQNTLPVPNGLMSALSDNVNANNGMATHSASALMTSGIPSFGGSNNFSYDLFNKAGIDLSKNLDFDDFDEDDEDIDMDEDSDEDMDGNRQKKRAKTSLKQMTEEQKFERRERNREHAKRSRVRKKFLLESLQKSVNALEDENDKLKNSIKQHLGEEQAEVVLSSLDTGSKDSLVTADPKSATKILDDPDYTLVKALQTAQQNFVITDPALHDHPIVYASQGFMALTGYKLEQILGRNCRFLQGPDTDPEAVAQVREAIQNGTDCSVCLLNYRADGSTFWNQFFIAALRDSDGAVVNYVGVQCKIREDVAKEIVAAEREKRKELKMAREKCPV